MAFGPGLHVFPGGKVDPEDVVAARSAAISDRELAAMGLGRNLEPVDALALHIAACREVAEEVNVTLDPGALVPIAHWTTPPFMPRRFSTWFFVADLPQGAEPVFAPDEVQAHRWVTPDDALDAMAAGEVAMWVPTTSVLERLVEVGARWAADVRAQIHLRLVRGPRVEKPKRDRVEIATDAAGGLPGRTGRSTLIGRRELVVVDPGDPSDAAIDAIRRAAVDRKGRIRAVVLTRPDPDHAAGAEALAIPLEVPVLAAPRAGRHLPYEVQELTDGERLPTDVGVVVRLGTQGSGVLRLERA
jgi:8-oxo-dGTP pyrophosphatase MutT (NUDIX family)